MLKQRTFNPWAGGSNPPASSIFLRRRLPPIRCAGSGSKIFFSPRQKGPVVLWRERRPLKPRQQDGFDSLPVLHFHASVSQQAEEARRERARVLVQIRPDAPWPVEHLARLPRCLRGERGSIPLRVATGHSSVWQSARLGRERTQGRSLLP